MWYKAWGRYAWNCHRGDDREYWTQQLSDYYGSDAWKHDFADDSAGLLPQDLKRGVLSEDAVWNLLEDVRDLKERMRNIGSPA